MTWESGELHCLGYFKENTKAAPNTTGCGKQLLKDNTKHTRLLQKQLTNKNCKVKSDLLHDKHKP